MKWKDLYKGMNKELNKIMKQPIPSLGIEPEQDSPEEGGLAHEITQTDHEGKRPSR